METTESGYTKRRQQFNGQRAEIAEVDARAILAELRALRRMFDEFAGTFLNARFPYGKGIDRWARR